MEKYAVVVAGGTGLRMGTKVPKQFLLLRDKPVLWYTLNTFLDAYSDLQIILVLNEHHLDKGQAILRSTYDPDRIWMTTGGETRFHSVRNGLQHIRRHSIVFVHDGVRCLLTPELIRRCYEGAVDKGNAIPATTAVDSVRLETVNGNTPIDRDRVRFIQTPQTFYSDIIKTAYEQDFHESFTDEASVVEKLGVKINLI
ncbi:MAG TPA: 2-C-methyl-D-erythritol 4-phosphate cytidylyltransferase, partial [Flavihumibacter sp.]